MTSKVKNPQAVRNAASVLIVAAIAAPGLILAPRPAAATWPPCGRAISTATSAQVHSAIATDSADGAIITWQDFRSPKINIFARRVLASGEPDAAWPADGRALLNDPIPMANASGGQTSPAIVPDGAGGAVVAWLDLRSSVTELDIFAQHVLASGVVDAAWPANGTALVSIEGPQNAFAIVTDGAGGAIVTWMDGRPGASVKDIYAQHVLASGVVDARWPANGLVVCDAPGLQEFPAIVQDASGGAIIAWDDGRSATSGFDIFAQHVSNAGVVDPAWPANGRALCAAPGDQGHPTITSDGTNGAVVAWSDSRIVGTSHIFAQHVLGTGVVDAAWPADGRALSAAGVLESGPRAVPDGAGGAVVTWQSFTIHLNMYAQHVTAGGAVDAAWPAGGRALSLTDRQQTHAEIVADGAGGAIVAWEDSLHVVAQHVLATGALDPAYPDTGRLVCNLPTGQGDVALVATSGSGAIAAWTDNRSGVDVDIFALQVLLAGTVDVPPPAMSGITFAPPSPNPGFGTVTLRFALPRSASASLAIFDARGRRIRMLASGPQSEGEHTITWDQRDESGKTAGPAVYFARLESEGRVFVRKLSKSN